jgi:hypothetical protein
MLDRIAEPACRSTHSGRRVVLAVLPESGPLSPRELEPAAVRGKYSAGPKFGRGDVR